MERERINQRLKSIVALYLRSGSDGEKQAALAAIRRMNGRYPWTVELTRGLFEADERAKAKKQAYEQAADDVAEQIRKRAEELRRRAAERAEERRREAQEEARRAAPPKPPVWEKPATEPGWEYRQCYKPTCRCMNGGKWHGPYRYAKKRRGAKVNSEYMGKA